MKNIIRIIVIITFVATALSCCRGNGIDSAFLEDNTIHLKVNGKNIFDFKETTCQLGYNASGHEYRVHDDTMANYYVVKLSEQPAQEGQSIKGDIEWTTRNNIIKKKDISFKVGKISSDNKIWLWDNTNKIGVVVMALL